jgi:hypothetical protein
MTEKKKRRGNPAWVKGGPSPNPKGSGIARLWIQKEVTEAVKTALETAHPEGPAGYFRELAQKKPELFVGIISKLMPTETAVNVSVSIGDAMADAQRRVEEYKRKMLDITPVVALESSDDAK